MTKEEIKSIKKVRYKLRENITKNINKGIKTDEVKQMVLDYHDLTKQLADAGCNVSIKLDYLQLDYWSNISNTTQVLPIQHIPPDIINDIIEPQKYTISLAWTETPDQSISDTINKIKEYFDDMDIKEIDHDTYKNGNNIENIIKYEFDGDDDSFKILKYSAQFLLDTISHTDYEKFNIAIYGKKK